jgi:hypothetical protein
MTTSLQGALLRSTMVGLCQVLRSLRIRACLILASMGSAVSMVMPVRSRVPKGLKMTGTPGVL